MRGVRKGYDSLDDVAIASDIWDLIFENVFKDPEYIINATSEAAFFFFNFSEITWTLI